MFMLVAEEGLAVVIVVVVVVVVVVDVVVVVVAPDDSRLFSAADMDAVDGGIFADVEES